MSRIQGCAFFNKVAKLLKCLKKSTMLSKKNNNHGLPNYLNCVLTTLLMAHHFNEEKIAFLCIPKFRQSWYDITNPNNFV